MSGETVRGRGNEELSLSFPTPCSRVSFRVPLARDFSHYPSISLKKRSCTRRVKVNLRRNCRVQFMTRQTRKHLIPAAMLTVSNWIQSLPKRLIILLPNTAFGFPMVIFFKLVLNWHDCGNSNFSCEIQVALFYFCHISKSAWSYENRVSKHFVIFRNFPCLIAWHMFTVLVAFVVVFFFACFVDRDSCRSGCRLNYYLTPLPFRFFSLPTILSWTQVTVIWNQRAPWCRLAV